MDEFPDVNYHYPEAICPLCSQIQDREHLRSHIQSEHARVQETTIKVIQAYHKSWVLEHGACEACWKSFRDAGRILVVLKQTRPQPNFTR